MTGHAGRRSANTLIEALRTHVPPRIELTRHDVPRSSYELHANEIITRLRSRDVDLLHVLTPTVGAAAAIYTAWSVGIPVVASGIWSLATGAWFHKLWFRELTRRCSTMLVSSSCERRFLLQHSAPEETIVAWRPGVDSSRFTPERRSAALREKWSVSDTRPAVAFVGELRDDENVQMLVTLEAELQRSIPIHRLIVVGDGPAQRELRHRCPHAIFAGSVTDQQLPDILAASDLFVWPSEQPSAAHVVLEAQSSGLPAVVMERGSGVERVCAASSATCDSVADLVFHTASLLRNHSRRKEMAKAARQQALQERWDISLAPVFAAYVAACARACERPPSRVFRPLLTWRTRYRRPRVMRRA